VRLHPLTYDEQKAAEAAFRGRPFDAAWSEAAQAIYQGIMAHTNGRDIVDATKQVESDSDELSILVGANS
jgi:hypothetical protein